MQDWQTKALEYLPELGEMIASQSSPMALCIELHFRLARAYDEEPINDDLIGRIYDYASWCFGAPRTEEASTDPSTAAAVALIENIPLDKRISEDLYRWFSVETFEGFENLFQYHLSDKDEYSKFRNEFMRKKETFKGPSRI